MTLPGAREWIFALKTLAAGLAALYVSMWAGLERPYWALATVYISSGALAGATRSKAVYRFIGTLVGAAAAVALTPALVNAPELLSLAIGLWVALCLYLSMLDRSARAYAPMLAGYTVALIGFPAVDTPGAIFDVAVSRAEEIGVGVLCAALASGTILPQSAVPAVVARVEDWIGRARRWALDALRRAPTPLDDEAERLRLAADAIALDAFAAPLRHEPWGGRGLARALAALRQHMLMFLPIAASISDRAEALSRAGALGNAGPAMSEMSDWLASGSTAEAHARALRDKLGALAPRFGAPGHAPPDWRDLMRAGLVQRLQNFIDLRQDSRRLLRQIAAHAPDAPAGLAFSYTARARAVRHRDHGMALLSGLSASFAVGLGAPMLRASLVAVLISCAVWIALAWPGGSATPMFAAVASCLFAAQDDPAPTILGFAGASLIGVVGAGVVLFGLLPHATNFEMVALALAPGLLASGLLLALPRTAAIGAGASVTGTSALAIQNAYGAELPDFVQSSVALIAGAWIAAFATSLVRSVGAGFSAERLRRVNRRSLVAAAQGRGGESGLELAALMLDRLGLLAPRLAALPREDVAGAGELLKEVRVGINVVELRRVRRQLPARGREAVNAALAGVARHFRGRDDAAPPELLGRIDAALDAVAPGAGSAAADAALLGLAGLRLALFPDAPDWRVSEGGAA
ncbi:FUSC family protein [Methylocella sp.]|uniref:FUSC family protein n=1 Tax=Methylocella sp. TaxID=1978226 RepID=UPI003783BE1C